MYLTGDGRLAWEGVTRLEGFVFADPFDEFLRKVSASYLGEVWHGLAACLEQHGYPPQTLQWGAGHPGYTQVRGADQDSPLATVGWFRKAGAASLWAGPYSLSEQGASIERCLQDAGVPAALAAADLRGTLAFVVDGLDLVPVEPGDSNLGLEVVVAHCTDPADWLPDQFNDGDTPCERIAAALRSRSAVAFHESLEAAREAYTPVGYRIATLGFTGLVLNWVAPGSPGMDRPESNSVTVTLADGTEVFLASKGAWDIVSLTTPDGARWWEYVRADDLNRFWRAARFGEPAELVSLGRGVTISASNSAAVIRFRSEDREVALASPDRAALLNGLKEFLTQHPGGG